MPDEALRLERPPTHRVGSGLAVADLLSGPSPATPARRPSYEEASVAEDAGPSKVSPITAKRDGPTPLTPSKQVPSSNTQPVTPEAANEGLTYQYPPVQQVLEGRENIEYLLHIREQPKHSRMCGVGEKADRRPIDPAPIIQLRVIIHPQSITQAGEGNAKAAEVKDSSTISTPYQKSDASVPQLRRGEPVVTALGEGWEDRAWYLENPYYFMCAMLADAEKDDELHLLSDGKTRYTTGSCVSCLYHLRDIDGSHQGFFVFPDLSIRVEGRYRLKLCLFETIGNQVHHCKSIYSDPFMVYTAKRFPGMEESTRLSRSFADQGLKVRVRKNTRGRKGRGAKAKADHEDASDGEDDAQRASAAESSQKRMRSDSWLSAGSTSDYSAGPGPSGMMAGTRDPRHPHRPMSPISPRIGWSGPSPSGANYIAQRSIEPFHYQPYAAGGNSRANEDAARGRSLSLVEERALRSRGQHLPPLPAPRETAWHSGGRLPNPASTAPGSPAERSLHPAHPAYRSQHSPHPPQPLSHGTGSPPHPPHYVVGPPPVHPHPLDPRSRPASPEASWGPVYGTNAAGVARQRSFSSAASLAPRPWEHRPSSHSVLGPQRPASNAGGSHGSSTQQSPASMSAAPSRPRSPSGGGSASSSHYRSSLAFNPPRPGGHGSHPRLSSHLAGAPISHHSRERSLSDPRKVFRPPPSAWASSLPLPPASRFGSASRENGHQLTLPPLGEPGRRAGEYAPYAHTEHGPSPNAAPGSRGEREGVTGWQREHHERQ